VQAASDKGRSDAPFFDPPSALPVFVIGQPPLSPAFGELTPCAGLSSRMRWLAQGIAGNRDEKCNGHGSSFAR
jgi:hypothetical protein